MDMLKMFRFALIFLVVAPVQVFADGDAVKGEKLFARCIACHSIKDTANRTGPHLKGIVGRPVATAEGYTYSKAMLEFAKTTGVWDEMQLDSYLANPRGVVKGTKMAFGPTKKPEERADIIAYLKTITP
jgi:cytochrome c